MSYHESSHLWFCDGRDWIPTNQCCWSLIKEKQSTAMVTLSQVLAFYFTYDRLFRCCLLLPFLVALAPFFAVTYFGACNLMSGGYAGLFHVTTLSVIALGYLSIQTLARTEESFQRSLRINRKYIPGIMLLCSFVTRSLSRGMPSELKGPSFWILSFGQSTRLATWLMLMGIAVASRYVGPQSIGKLP